MAVFRPAVAVALMLVAGAAAAGEAATPFGLWFTQERDGAFELYPCGGDGLCGRLVWMADESPDPGSVGPPRDLNNPDPALRRRTVCGLEMVRGFHRDEDGVWNGGTIYNPQDGEQYRAFIEVRGPYSLGLRGYILIPLLGRTQTWTRVPPDFAKRCHAE